MKKLVMVVVGFGLVFASVASASVERPSGLSLALGEKKANEMNGRMLACGRPARMKAQDGSEAPRVAQSQGSSSSSSAWRTR